VPCGVSLLQRIQDIRRIRGFAHKRAELVAKLGEAGVNERFVFMDVSHFPDLERELYAKKTVRL
jgi:hypothetical protein